MDDKPFNLEQAKEHWNQPHQTKEYRARKRQLYIDIIAEENTKLQNKIDGIPWMIPHWENALSAIEAVMNDLGEL